MNQFKFTTEATTPLDIPTALPLVRNWIKRRKFPIRIVEITPCHVIVDLDSSGTLEHNRAVNALARILSNHLDQRHFVESRLNPTYY
jgi:hypothetical protein